MQHAIITEAMPHNLRECLQSGSPPLGLADRHRIAASIVRTIYLLMKDRGRLCEFRIADIGLSESLQPKLLSLQTYEEPLLALPSQATTRSAAPAASRHRAHPGTIVKSVGGALRELFQLSPAPETRWKTDPPAPETRWKTDPKDESSSEQGDNPPALLSKAVSALPGPLRHSSAPTPIDQLADACEMASPQQRPLLFSVLCLLSAECGGSDVECFICGMPPKPNATSKTWLRCPTGHAICNEHLRQYARIESTSGDPCARTHMYGHNAE
jgi:hypothetical protein